LPVEKRESQLLLPHHLNAPERRAGARTGNRDTAGILQLAMYTRNGTEMEAELMGS
jgi:hypothetical protein